MAARQKQVADVVTVYPAYKATGPDDVWACDITTDEDERGRPLEWLAVIDEFTRQCMLLDVARAWNSSTVVKTLDSVVRTSHAPSALRTDNNKLWRSVIVREWLSSEAINLRMIRRGSPWENGHVESFFGRLRHELLFSVEFTSIPDARFQAARWRDEYNFIRPHGALGYVPPGKFRQAFSDRSGQRSPGPP